MITYSQIPTITMQTSGGWKEPIFTAPRLPPEGATIHAAKGIPDPIYGGFNVEYDHAKAKPGDWLEITLPDQPLLPVFTATPWSMTDDERQRTAFHLVNLAVILNARADDWEKSTSLFLRAAVSENRNKAEDAATLARKIMP